MGTILIDKLLSACVKQGASDLHITVGQPPVLRLSGRMQRLKTKVLEPVDTQALMAIFWAREEARLQDSDPVARQVAIDLAMRTDNPWVESWLPELGLSVPGQQ